MVSPSHTRPNQCSDSQSVKMTMTVSLKHRPDFKSVWKSPSPVQATALVAGVAIGAGAYAAKFALDAALKFRAATGPGLRAFYKVFAFRSL